MIQVAPYIIAALREDGTFTFPNVEVEDFYSVDEIRTLLVTVDESPSDEGIAIDDSPLIVSTTITVETYGQQLQNGAQLFTAKESALKLMEEVAAKIAARFGLRMVGSVTIRPYTDPTKVRAVARWTGYIDTRRDTNNIYRRI